MNTWREYIKSKFGDKSRFLITDLEDGEYVQIKSTDKNIETIIEFVFIDQEKLEDIHFWGTDKQECGTWMSHFTLEKEFRPNVSKVSEYVAMRKEMYYPTSLPFTESIIQRVENEWLNIPLKLGWNEMVILAGNKLIKSHLTLVNKNHKTKGSKYFKAHNITFINWLKKTLSIDLHKNEYEFKPLS